MGKLTAEWINYSDEELLKVRICDLKLEIAGTFLESQIQTLYADLEHSRVPIKPKVYLGDEWFSPEGVVAIAIPFYLAHPRLMALEEKMMLEVEGGTPEWCMKILRHESGHCFDHAFKFSKRQKWAELFGVPSASYHPESYRPRPYSRNFVRYLDNWYSQSHPDEDFAETFAVWLDPSTDWRHAYSKWNGALRKLEYVDRIAREIRGRKSKTPSVPLISNASRMKTTLGRYYERKKRENAQDYPDFFDEDLNKIFGGGKNKARKQNGAGQFLKRNRKVIVDTVSGWSAAKKHVVHHLIKRLIDRCDEHDLRVGKGVAQTNLELAAYLSALATHYLFTGKFKEPGKRRRN